MSLVQWLAVAGVVLFLGILLLSAWLYATRRLGPGLNRPGGRSGWLPHSLRMKPLGHGIYHAHDERRAERQEPEEKR